jgi:hypothetical protein
MNDRYGMLAYYLVVAIWSVAVHTFELVDGVVDKRSLQHKHKTQDTRE